MPLQSHVSLQPLHTFQTAAQARYYSYIQDRYTLQHLLTQPVLQAQPKLVLGGGSNVLFLTDFDGWVIHVGIEGLEKIHEDAHYVWIRAGAGLSWHQLVDYCVARGYGGIENLSLIPGTVGGAPIQNIGAYGATLCEVFVSLEAMHVRTARVQTFDRTACAFGYRDSVFKHALRGQYIILGVTLRLHKQPKLRTSYGAIEATLDAMGVTRVSIQTISQAIMRIRQQKLPDPKVLGNAGSFFKNPIVDADRFTELKRRYTQLPGYGLDDGSVKMSAAWLIERGGWKGYRRGATGVYARQPLVLVNHGGATGEAIYQLAQDIQASVQAQFGIVLQPEVCIIGMGEGSACDGSR